MGAPRGCVYASLGFCVGRVGARILGMCACLCASPRRYVDSARRAIAANCACGRVQARMGARARAHSSCDPDHFSRLSVCPFVCAANLISLGNEEKNLEISKKEFGNFTERC